MPPLRSVGNGVFFFFTYCAANFNNQFKSNLRNPPSPHKRVKNWNWKRRMKDRYYNKYNGQENLESRILPIRVCLSASLQNFVMTFVPGQSSFFQAACERNTRAIWKLKAWRRSGSFWGGRHSIWEPTAAHSAIGCRSSGSAVPRAHLVSTEDFNFP